MAKKSSDVALYDSPGYEFTKAINYEPNTPTRDFIFCFKNKKLRAENVLWNPTQDEVTELVRCARDINYFAENYVKIITLDDGLTDFDPRDFQEEIYNTIVDEKFIAILAPRQCGKTIAVVIAILWHVLFNEHYVISIMANKGDNAKGILKRVKLAYEHLPYWLKPGVKNWAKQSIEFDNGSSITAGTTSEDSGRSESVNMLILEEFAFVKSHIAKEFYTSAYPTISGGLTSKLVMVSTPNGVGNVYHEVYTKGKRGINQYKTIRVKWDQVPGRDDEFKKATIADIGELKWNQEYECKFVGSTTTLIHSNSLEAMVPYDPVGEEKRWGGDHRWWSQPKPGHTYAFGVDTGHGVQEDDSVINIFDITDPLAAEQVAVWSSNIVGTADYPAVINELGLFWNIAPLLVENNNMGDGVINDLWWDYEYEHIISHGSDKLKGILGSRKVKSRACSHLKSMCEKGRVLFRDAQTIRQLSSFSSTSTGGFAGDGCKDDHVMSALWAIYSTNRDIIDKIDFVDESEEFGQESHENRELSTELKKKRERAWYESDEDDEEGGDNDLPDLWDKPDRTFGDKREDYTGAGFSNLFGK